MTLTAALPDSITAHVASSAIDKVTRFFNATLSDAFVELLQNSRRSNSTRIAVTVDPLQHGEHIVIVTDDGNGISDPSVLLAFGRSGWDPATAQREDPAGIGVYALSRMGCSVSSRPDAGFTGIAQGWRAQITPDCFLGRTCATVQPTDQAPYPHGTAISFVTNQSVDAVRAAVAQAAHHYPLTVQFNGEALPRKVFLDGAIHVERWKGLVFGVFPRPDNEYQTPALNFHGLTVRAGFPSIDTIDRSPWSVRADIESCPELEFVLPARKELIENQFVAEMRDAGRLAIYRAIRNSDNPPALSHNDYSRAHNAGIDVPAAPARLRPWRPSLADTNGWHDTPNRLPVPPTARVIEIDPEPQDSQAFWRAAETAELGESLFESDRRLNGYPWYDSLARINRIDFTISDNGTTHTLDSLRAPDASDTPNKARPDPDTLQRPNSILVTLHVTRADDPASQITIPAHVAFAGEGWCHIEEAEPIVTRDSTLEPHELADLLYAAFFSPSDDADADSWETQRERFQDDAMHIAVKLLASEEEARRISIASAVSRDISWLIPRDREVHIHVIDRKITVEFTPKSRTAEPAAP